MIAKVLHLLKSFFRTRNRMDPFKHNLYAYGLKSNEFKKYEKL